MPTTCDCATCRANRLTRATPVVELELSPDYDPFDTAEDNFTPNIQPMPVATTNTASYVYRCYDCDQRMEGEPALRSSAYGDYCPSCCTRCTCGCNRMLAHYPAQGIMALTARDSRHTRRVMRCHNSAYACSVCSTWYVNEYGPPTSTNAYPQICPDCESHMGDCPRCGLREDTRNFECAGNELVCYRCYSTWREERRIIKGHDYKPEPKFFKAEGEKNPAVYYGVELEIDGAGGDERGEDNIRTIGLNQVPFLYCKYDGSLQNGFEIVSHPASFDFWMQQPLDYFDKLVKQGYRSYNTTTCGMHVHISKDYLGKLGALKLMDFMAANPQFVLKMSRRRREELEHWAHPSRGSRARVDRIMTAMHGNYHEDRYRAVNCENSKTLEIRIFRGTLNPDAFKLNIAFVHTLATYARQSGMRAMSPSYYLDWLRKHPHICGKTANKVYQRLISWVSGAVVPDVTVER